MATVEKKVEEGRVIYVVRASGREFGRFQGEHAREDAEIYARHINKRRAFFF